MIRGYPYFRKPLYPNHLLQKIEHFESPAAHVQVASLESDVRHQLEDIGLFA